MIYDGLSIETCLDFLKNTKVECYERSHPTGPGKDDLYYEYQKIEFTKPPNNMFFTDLMQIFDIFWYDLENDNYNLASKLGSGFFRFNGPSHAYSHTPSWQKTTCTKDLKDAIKWIEEIFLNNPFAQNK